MYQRILSVCCSVLFFCSFCLSPAPAHAEGNGADSVNWDGIDLTAKAPKPKPTDREKPGEKLGLCGPIITYGGKGSGEAIVVYDQCGLVSGVVTKKDAKKDPEKAKEIIKQACSDAVSEHIPHFFSGQLLTGTDLTALVDYVTPKARLAHHTSGNGVVCGLDVKNTPGTTGAPGTVTVQPGIGFTLAEGDATKGGEEDVHGYIKVNEWQPNATPHTKTPGEKQPGFDTQHGGQDKVGIPSGRRHSGITSITADDLAPLPKDRNLSDIINQQPDVEHTAGVSSGGTFAGISPRISFSYDLTGDGKNVIKPQYTRFTPPAGYQPRFVMIGRLALTPQELEECCDFLIDNLRSGKLKREWMRAGLILGGIYFLEQVFLWAYQDVPNDPLYFTGRTKKGSKGGGGFKIGFGGVKLGGGSSRSSSKAKDQWGLPAVGFTLHSDPGSAWAVEAGHDKNVTVAIIDSGLYMEHPDGPQYVWTNEGEIPGNNIDDDGNGYVDDIHGWNFMDENNDLTDTKGHGTFVAGIIAAKTNNGIGIAGINPGAVIMPLKVGDEKHMPHQVAIFRALRYAVNNGAKVINISLGGEGLSQLAQLGINYAYAKGAVVVVAGGNQAEYMADYSPGNLRRTLPVAAMDISGERAVISNEGENLALIAPGEEIYSLHSADAEWLGPSAQRERLYLKQSGTSFSSPIVAGTASLMLAHDPTLTNAQVEDILLATARDRDIPGWDERNGAGLLNAAGALRTTPDNILTIRPTEVLINRDGRKIDSVDIFGVIRGDLTSYTVEVGKGKKPKKWKPIAASVSETIEYGRIARINKDGISNRGDWTVRITATGKNGTTKTAQLPLRLEQKKD